MKSLFDQTRIGALSLKNRFVRAAVADRTMDGFVGDDMVETYRRLARGGVGTIITGLTLVDGEEKFLPVIALCGDDFIPGHRRVTDAVHQQDVNILAQLVYIGSYTAMGGDNGGMITVAPSAVPNLVTGTPAREIRENEIKTLQGKFARAAMRAREAGYDGVELHAAHGFLLSQFLTPHYNRRTDAYGGPIENRARMLLETCAAVREAVGGDYPIWVKINSTDGIPEGISPDEVRYVCRELTGAGINAIEISGNWSALSQQQGPYFTEAAGDIAAECDTAVVLTGGIRDIAAAARILNETNIGYFGIARPLIKEPDWVNRQRAEASPPA